jgi:UDP-glucose 4-epimerase
MSKILITGGAGYIGSHTIVDLIENKFTNLISVDNFSNSTDETFNRIKEITGVEVKNYPIDLCNLLESEKIFIENPDITGIIHFAAYKAVGESVQKPLKYYHNNIESLVNILKLAKKYNIPHIIFSSSCSVYGNIDKLPVTEETPLPKAESPYAYTKQIGERILQDFLNISPNQKAIALRYFNPVGAHPTGKLGEVPIGVPNNLVPFITQTAIGIREKLTIFGNDYPTKDGTCIRDYIHVSDIAHAHVLALKKLMHNDTFPQFDIINLGTGNGVSVKEAVDAFEKVTGVKLNYEYGPRRAGDAIAIYANNQKAIDTLGWKPKYSLDDMMLSAWKWEKNLQQANVNKL